MTRLCALLVLGVLACAAGAAAAEAQQQPPPRRPPPANTDSLRRAQRDSSRKTKKDTTQLAPPDSAMRALMARKGYVATRYQGDSVTFDAKSNSLLLFGKPSLVLYDKLQVSGTDIAFDDVIKRLTVFSRTAGVPAVVHDPAQSDDIVAYDTITYNLNERRGVAGHVETSAENGAIWCMSFERAGFMSDSLSGNKELLGRKVRLSTDCSENPHYHFEVPELKKIGKNTLVGSPAVLYIGEVPVFWLPWFFQPEKKGRNSGVLTPQFGFAELVRNSAGYRRTVENVGYYAALNDYSDAQISMDWRSGARPTQTDPGFVKLQGRVRYRWLDRFITGQLGVTRDMRDDGSTVTSYNLGHSQQFSRTTQLRADLNYSSNTVAAQRTILNPLAVVANIRSSLNYSTRLGPFQTSLGGSQVQYIGRTPIDRTFPTLSMSTSPIRIASWLTWTPTMTGNITQNLHLDAPTEFAFERVPNASGGVDSVRRDRRTRNSSFSFGTPFKLGASTSSKWTFNITANATVSDRLNDFPEAKIVIDPVDTSRKRTVVFARTYLTTFDWNLGMNLPQFSQGRWNLVPSVALQNVDPGGFMVRSERSGANFVTQSKRAVYGLSISPTFFARTGGIGPFAAIRHSLSPQLTYSYSPAASVSDEFLAALGRVRPGYLGALAQNRISLTLNQVFEAKFRSDSTAEVPATADRKIKLLSINLTPVDYDFELAKKTGRLGFASDRFGWSVRSDLLPGFDFHVDYSLFDAPV
ncbi:MAG TPA: putative LPS assembly protein LptD, partial [Gemmatimonadaceae bacterium]|nr:putative LPS assembly protein LptD [Gemmatimonadaceae bacterium]